MAEEKKGTQRKQLENNNNNNNNNKNVMIKSCKYVSELKF